MEEMTRVCEISKSPIPGEDLCKPCHYSNKWRQAEWEAWDKCTSVQGLELFRRNSLSNQWLRGFSGMSGDEFINALKIRTNVFPVRMVTSRGAENRHTECRRCGDPFETLSHVLGQCAEVKGARIERHHKLCKALIHKVGRIDDSIRVVKETTFISDKGQRKRPDVVFIIGNRGVIVDPTIRFEVGMSLSEAYRHKCDWYKDIVGAVKKDLGVTEVSVHGLVVGARGGWAPENELLFKELGIRGSKFAQSLVQLALVESARLLKVHYNGTRS